MLSCGVAVDAYTCFYSYISVGISSCRSIFIKIHTLIVHIHEKMASTGKDIDSKNIENVNILILICILLISKDSMI